MLSYVSPRWAGILGLVTETGEVATIIKRHLIYGKPLDDKMRADAKEELGDILWYVPTILQAIDDPARGDWSWFETHWKAPHSDLDGCIRSMVYRIGTLVQCFNTAEYDSSFKTRTEAALMDICGNTKRIATLLDLGPIGGIMEANIAKLRLRYPDKFTQELAEARLDKGGLDARES